MQSRALPALFLACGCGAAASPVVSVVIPAAEPGPADAEAPSATTAAKAPAAAPSGSAMTVEQELAQLDVALVNPRSGGAGVGGLRLGSGGGGVVWPGSSASAGGAVIGGRPSLMGKVTIGKVGVKGSVSNAGPVVAGMAAGFRRCFNKGLQQDPSMTGSIVITAKLGPAGEVLSASPSGVSGLAGTVVSCMAARVSSAQFAPPGGGAATVTIPVKLEIDSP